MLCSKLFRLFPRPTASIRTHRPLATFRIEYKGLQGIDPCWRQVGTVLFTTPCRISGSVRQWRDVDKLFTASPGRGGVRDSESGQGVCPAKRASPSEISANGPDVTSSPPGRRRVVPALHQLRLIPLLAVSCVVCELFYCAMATRRGRILPHIT